MRGNPGQPVRGIVFVPLSPGPAPLVIILAIAGVIALFWLADHMPPAPGNH